MRNHKATLDACEPSNLHNMLISSIRMVKVIRLTTSAASFEDL